MGDLFAVQDEITARIVSTIAGQLEERDRQLQTIGNEQDLTNYQNTLLAERCLRQGGKTETLKARSLFKKVVSAEPLNARAHSGLARTYLEELWSYWETGDQGVGPLGLQSALRAVELDPLDPKARINLGVAYLLVSSDFEKALIQFGKACELNRSDAEAFCFSGWCYALSGKVDPAIEATDVSIRLNPFDYHDCFHAKAIAAYLDNDYERCLDFLRNVTPSGFSASSPMLAAACHAKLGKMDKARDAISKFLHEARENIENYPGEEPAAWRNYWAKQYPFRDPADLERLLSALRLAGFPV